MELRISIYVYTCIELGGGVGGSVDSFRNLQADRADDDRVQRESAQLRAEFDGEIAKQRQREAHAVSGHLYQRLFGFLISCAKSDFRIC